MDFRGNPAAEAEAERIKEEQGFDPLDEAVVQHMREQWEEYRSRVGCLSQFLGIGLIVGGIVTFAGVGPYVTGDSGVTSAIIVSVVGIAILFATWWWPGRKYLAAHRIFRREVRPVMKARYRLWAAVDPHWRRRIGRKPY